MTLSDHRGSALARWSCSGAVPVARRDGQAVPGPGAPIPATHSEKTSPSAARPDASRFGYVVLIAVHASSM